MEPVAPNTNIAAAPSATVAPDERSVPVYYARDAVGSIGVANFGQTPAVLGWAYSQGVVWLRTIGGETIFQTNFGEVSSMVRELGTIKLTVSGNRYMLYARDASANPGSMSGPLGDSAAGYVATDTLELARSDIKELEAIINSSGGHSHHSRPGLLFIKLLAGGFLLLWALAAAVYIWGTLANN